MSRGETRHSFQVNYFRAQGTQKLSLFTKILVTNFQVEGRKELKSNVVSNRKVAERFTKEGA
jgi:hypothetical protein